jgi:predicted GIY-YIG superfamily endonuclease
MPFLSTNGSVQPACTNTIFRPIGDIAGLREVHDNVSRLTVSAFPITMANDIALTHLAVPGCYVLADHEAAYLGESRDVRRRLNQHATDPSKAFAREVYVISGYERPWFDKTAAIYLQYRLTEIAEQAGLVEIIKGVSPQVLELSDCERAPLDQYVEFGERLLFDAGCRVFRSNFPNQRRKTIEAAIRIDPDEAGPIRIGVIATPPLGSELELDYCDLWARGYPAQGGFVVMAGSELRTQVNSSVNPILHTRRAELAAAGALGAIPGVQNRQRLLVAVWLPSAAIAAKVVTGAHVNSSKWIQPRHPRGVLVAA